jgi:Rad3-related DNA helicase
MLVNERGEAPTEIIQLFKESGPGTILVSPAVGQGHDFPGSACEWQLLCKIPFPPPSAILKRRTEDDKEYPHYLTMQKMVQIFGRGMRSQDDQCENFIVDDHCEWFVPRYAHLAPHSFRMFFQTVTRLPAPPPAL